MHAKVGLLTILSASLLGATALKAEETDSDEALKTIVVSAGRVPLEAEKVGRAYNILSGETLEKNQSRYVADALREIPGLAVSRTGSFGGLTQIRVRGSEGNHVLVLIDGVEVSETSQGEYDFGGLQVADVERIEVLRGPQSALYGSNATAGVIHIITKPGKRNQRKITAKTEYGTDNTVLASLAARGGGETYDLAVSGSYRRTDGFNISHTGSEEDGDRNVTLNGKFNWDISDQVAFHTSLRYVDRDSDTDNQVNGQATDSNSYAKTKEFYAGTGLDVSLFDDRFVNKTRFEYTDVERDGLGWSKYGNSGERYHFSHQATLFFDAPSFADSHHSLTGAFEWERETFRNDYPSSPSQIPTQTRNLFGYVAEYKGEFWDSLFVGAALRFDQNDKFEDAVTYSADIAYLIDRTNTRLHASLGTGVTNPTFYEQFGFNPSTFIGNPNLEPEENFGWDIGIEQKFFDERMKIDVTYFNERLKNEIKTVSTPPTYVSSPINLDGTSKRHGVEVAGSARITDNFSVRGSYTYLISKEPNGDTEVRRPKHSGSLGMNLALLEGKANLFADAIYRGEIEDSVWMGGASQVVTVDDYVLVNAGGDYQITDNVKAFARVENLLDTDYEEVFGYNTQGRTFFIGLQGTF